jgi:hypothetical protein
LGLVLEPLEMKCTAEGDALVIRPQP